MGTFLATWGFKLALPFLSALMVYLVDKVGPKVYASVPSEMLPALAGAMGVMLDQVAQMSGAGCPGDMPQAACIALSALLGLAGTGLDQLRKKLADYARDGGSPSRATA